MQQTWIEKAKRRLGDEERIHDGHWTTVMFPKYEDGKLYGVVAPCNWEGPASTTKRIDAPKFLAYVPYPDADRVETKDVKPKDVGIKTVAANGEVGNLLDLSKLPHGHYTDLEEEYDTLVSKVMEQGWLKDKTATAERGKVARRLAEILKEMTPKSLADLYNWLGQDLLAWIKSASKS